MPRDPYAALHALLRAEAVRTAPPEATRTPKAARTPEPTLPLEPTRTPEVRRTEAPGARAAREGERRGSETPAPEIR